MKDQIDGRATLQRLDLGRHVGQHADLRGNGVAFPDAVEQAQQFFHARGIVGYGVHADDGVAAPIAQPFQNAGGDAFGIVGRMVGLQTRGEAAR